VIIGILYRSVTMSFKCEHVMVETRDLNGFFSLSFLEDIKQESNILRER